MGKVVKLNLSGKDYNLYFTLNSLVTVEKLTGKPFSQALDNVSMEAIRDLVFAGIVHDKNSDLTPEDVGEMIGFNDIPRISQALEEALQDIK